jgi:segregation and condensation protein B
LTDSNDKFDDETNDPKSSAPQAADDSDPSLQADQDQDLDAKLLEAAQRWAEEFNPMLGSEDEADELVLSAADEPKSKGKGKKAPKKFAREAVETRVVEFEEPAASEVSPLETRAEPVAEADEVNAAAEDEDEDESENIKADVEQELLAYGDTLAERAVGDDTREASSEPLPEDAPEEAIEAETVKPKKKSRKSKDAGRSGATAIDPGSDEAHEFAEASSSEEEAPKAELDSEIPGDDKQGLMRWDEAINLEAQVEAVLFAAPKPISISEIAETLGDDDGNEPEHGVIDAIVQQLFRLYKERSGGFRLEYDKGSGYQFRTVPAAAPIMERMFSSRQRPLSRAAHETLAIIAYRQPCTRADIEFIRGVDAGSIIKNLLERDLVACVGRKEDSGRPMLFGTTAEFMRVFRIQTLNDLPPLSAFQPASEAMIDAFQKIDRPDLDIDVEDFIGDESQGQPEISAGLSSDFAKSEGVFEVREDGSESSAPDDAQTRRSGGIFDNEGFLSDGHENTEVALPTRDSLAEGSGEASSRGSDQHQRPGGSRTRDEDQS